MIHLPQLLNSQASPANRLSGKSNRCSIEKFIGLALTLFFKRQQHRKLSWLDEDSDKDQSKFDELFN
jgi:hypothetical protein